MSLFAYYAWHSFKNQLKKLFKTWVLIFLLVCMLIGGLIGGGIATLENIAEDQNPGTEIEDITEDPVDVPEIIIPEGESRVADITELIAGLAALGLMLLFIKGADKNGAAIFLPADVALLFTSPMKPQAVLAFRTMCTIGLVLLTSVYMLFQIPNLVINVGLSIWQALSILLAWFFVFLFGQLIKIFLYTLCSTKLYLKKYITPGILGIIGIAGIGYIVFHVLHDMSPLESAVAFFNSPVSRYIPIWGWTKGIVGASFDNSLSSALIFTGLNILAASLIVGITWRIKADFYEDAMAKSEETAAILRDAQERGSLAGRSRKKDRSEKLLRDAFNKGQGASVFYYKSMYNRRRFAIAAVFTKTSITYIAVAVLISVLFLRVFTGSEYGQIAVVMALGVMVFYRTLGNPLESDTKSQYFALIPEPIGKKVFYSLLGSCVNSILDVIPALLVSTLMLRASFINAIAWILFLVSIDAYATIVGTFIALSVPTSAGTNIKQVVQIMFIYFGLLPDIAVMAVGFVMGSLFTAALICVAINLALFGVFFALTTNFICPISRRVEGIELSKKQLKQCRKTFSRVSFVPIVMAGVAVALQVAIVAVLKHFGIDVKNINGYLFILNFLPMYAVGLPMSTIAVWGIKADKLETRSFGIKNMLKSFAVCMAFMYTGNIIGTLITSALSSATGSEAEFIIGDLINEGDSFWIILFVVIIGPIVEELIFRKIMIDRLSRYGRSLAIVFSALAFGLFHGNLNQFFYATALGLIFGYIYTKTGRLIYSVILHMCVNFLGSVVSVFVVSKIDFDSIAEISEISDPSELISGGFVLFGIYILFILAMVITGWIIFFANLRKLELPPASMPVMKKERFRTAYLNIGFICILLYFIVSTVMTFVDIGGLL
jgi:membrane protease YdiL (CAAX protease family)